VNGLPLRDNSDLKSNLGINRITMSSFDKMNADHRLNKTINFSNDSKISVKDSTAFKMSPNNLPLLSLRQSLQGVPNLTWLNEASHPSFTTMAIKTD
jgi:hypothetical protein